MLLGPWHVEMLGGLRATNGVRAVTRFRSERTAGLFAYLAYHPGRPATRVELTDLFWPEFDEEHGRMSLRTALSSLRRQFEPPGTAQGSVVCADAQRVHLNPAAVTTDVTAFADAMRAADEAAEDGQRAERLETAVGIYRGDLLAGYFDTWIEEERALLAERYVGALRKLIRLNVDRRDFERALGFAARAAGAFPLREEIRRDLIRLHLALGHADAARQQFLDLERQLQSELGVEPSSATRALVEQMVKRPGAARPARPREDERPTADLRPHAGVSAPSGRLPMPLNRFFGREIEMGRILDVLRLRESAERLLTISGPGGTGKTRLAAEAANRLQAEFEERVWFVPLGDIRDARFIPSEILDCLQIAAEDTDPAKAIAAKLGESPALIVLDNFEQLVGEGPAYVLALLAHCPGLRILITSRRRLGVPGERELALAPLPTPGDVEEPRELLAFPSVQLYVDRAQSSAADFQITRGNAASVSALCERLEGIPLSIELAAARAQVLTPSQILEKLDQRFEILASRRMDKSSRQRSLWAAIDWSYNLLSPPLQRFFTRLSVFRGGWTAEAAAEVCDEPSSLEYLTQLRGHSLAHTYMAGSAFRFGMLETIREFAGEQLGEDSAAIRKRHAGYFAKLAAEAAPRLPGSEQAAWLAQLEADSANLREALRTMLDSGRGRNALKTTSALWRFWWVRGLTAEAGHWIQESLTATAEASPLERAEALQNLGNLAWREGDGEKALELHREGLTLSEAAGDGRSAARSLTGIGNACRSLHRSDEAKAAYEQSLVIFRKLADRQGIATSLLNLGTLSEDQLDLEQAFRYYHESLLLYRELGDLHSECLTLCNLANICIDQGNAESARAFLFESGRIGLELEDHPRMGEILVVSAKLALLEGDYARAASVLGATDAYHQAHSLTLSAGYRSEMEATVSRICEHISRAEYEFAHESGRSLSAESALCLSAQ